MIEDPQLLKQALLQKGLFDEAYYEANYGETIPPGEPLIEHFVRVGHELGYAPCAAFDPVLHRVRHGLKPPSAWPERAHAERRKRGPQDHFPQVNFQVYFWSSQSDEDLKGNIGEFFANPTRPGKLPTPIGVYGFRNPPSAAVFKAIQKGRPFSVVRLPHGFWDCLNAVDRVSSQLKDDARARPLSEDQRRALATRLLAALNPQNGNFGGDFLQTALTDLQAHPRDEDLLTGISFKGMPTYEDSAFGTGPPTPDQLARTARFSQFFSPHDRLYDAMMWKRWAILGGLKDLPRILRGRPLILVARASFGVLAERLGLPHLVHVEVPPQKTQLIRRQVLARIEAAIRDQPGRDGRQAPVVLLQSGSTLGYYFVRRLRQRFPQVTYLDIGEALNIWCMDRAGINMWIEAYREQIAQACGIEGLAGAG